MSNGTGASVRFLGRAAGGLTIRSGPVPATLPANRHCHASVELVMVDGQAAWEFAGRRQEVTDSVVLFVSSFPHELVAWAGGTVLHAVAIPLPDALAWHVADDLEGPLGGDFLRDDSSAARGGVDAVAFARWVDVLEDGDAYQQHAARLEIEARAARLLRSVRAHSAPTDTERSAAVAGVGRAIRYIARHFREALTVDSIADAVGWHRDHLMASFRRVCGISVWQYVTRLRVAEAQRLLGQTSASVTRISTWAGFGSAIRMYDAFHRHLETTPAEYRRLLAG
jgi:AraC family transcriptional regulator, melibiose operon regulatory protein